MKKFVRDITIGGEKIIDIISFKLDQHFNAHHYFEFKFNHGTRGEARLIELDNSRGYVGKILTASFGEYLDKLHKFSGVVTKIELAQSNGFHGIVTASGYSPTIYLDRGPDLGSYYHQTLSNIVTQATRDTPANDLKIVLNPDRKKPVDYMIQYRESDFNFLNRLSAQYYEWFFYDGERLNFGKPDRQEEVAMIYGVDVKTLNYGIEVAPVNNTIFSYDPQRDEMLKSKNTANFSGRPDLLHATSASTKTFSKTYNQSSPIRVEHNSDVADQVANKEKANAGQLLKISGASDNHQIGIGKIASISMNYKSGSGYQLKSLGKFLITSVFHHIDEIGQYHNTFEGVVSTTERIPFEDYTQPAPDMVLAEVFDNKDPLGQGRVRVKFKWLCDTNDPTEWLRVISPDAGSSEKVSRNRGFVFIPEKDDQVIIGFEDGNIARPIVIGSVFHGKNGIGGNQNNDRKSLITKSGHTLSMDDSGGILLKDKTDLNFIAIDGKNAVTVKTDNSITLQTGKVMIIMDKENDKIIIQAKNIEIRAAEDFKVTGDGSPAKAGSMEFSDRLDILSNKDLLLVGESTAKLNGKKVSIAGGKTIIDGNPVQINS